ncbi:MAG TPA: tripartite tricarboxylate transporter substrate binding protein [Xanthobacteraceae bacterium]|nr:tripartite tricarboxylate transporter substrate binding protein [Xanthobacteraceae bacterium]
MQVAQFEAASDAILPMHSCHSQTPITISEDRALFLSHDRQRFQSRTDGAHPAAAVLSHRGRTNRAGGNAAMNEQARRPSMTGINRRQAWRGALASASLAACRVRSARAQARYPDRAIRVIVPFAAGGVGDSVMRVLAPRMEQTLGQKLVIEAKPGGAGNLGAREVARADPDGHTILVAAAGNFVINQFLTRMPFDPLDALTPIAKVAEVPIVFFAHPSLPARTLGELVAHARANPGKLNYASPGNGSINHLVVERLKQVADIDIIHVPFRGSPPAMLALLTNQVQLFPVGLVIGASHLQDGKLTALAVTTEKRIPALPDVPAAGEAGLPHLTISNWWGMAAPKGTPEPLIRVLDQAVVEALSDPTVVERFAALGLLVPTQTREQFAASLKPEAVSWSEIVRRGKIVGE